MKTPSPGQSQVPDTCKAQVAGASCGGQCGAWRSCGFLLHGKDRQQLWPPQGECGLVHVETEGQTVLGNSGVWGEDGHTVGSPKFISQRGGSKGKKRKSAKIV